MNFPEVTWLMCMASGLLVARGKQERWKFSFSKDGLPANHIDGSGNLVGQSVDMVIKICNLTNKVCDINGVDRIKCWNDKTLRSEVLDNGEADVCANLVESPDRNKNYRFASQSIYDIPNPLIITKKNSAVTLNDLLTCNDLILAYPSLTALNRLCLLKAGYFVKEKNVLAVVAEESIVAAQNEIFKTLENGTSDVAVIVPRMFTKLNDVTILGQSPCISQLIGLNMMVNKDDTRSSTFLQWWEQQLTKFICGKGQKDNDYVEFCELMKKKYQDVDPLCFSPGVDVECPGFSSPIVAPTPAPIDPCNP